MAFHGFERPEGQSVRDGERERELLLLAQRNDPAACRELYDRYRESVYNLAVYMVGDRAEAQDVLQVVFLKVFRGLPAFRWEAALSTWIYRIARNECQSYLRRRRTPQIPLEAVLGSSDEIDPRPGSDDQHAGRERQEIIRQAVMELSPAMREVVVLKYVEGLSYEEIGTVLGCAPGTVASRLNRALTRLERQLRPLRPLL